MIKRNFYRFVFNFGYPLLDFAVLTLAIVFAYHFYRLLGIGQQVYYADVHYLSTSLLAAAAAVMVMTLWGVYEKESGLLNVTEVRRTVQAITVSFLLFGIILVFGKILLSRYVLLFSYLFSVLFVVTEKMVLYNLPRPIKPVEGLHRKVLIYGAGELGRSLFREMASSPRLRIVPVGFVDDAPEMAGRTVYPSGYNRAGAIRVLGTGDDIPSLCAEKGLDEVYIDISDIEQERLVGILSSLKAAKITAYFVPRLYKIFLHHIRFSHIGNIPVVREVRKFPGPYIYVKRFLDLALAAAVLLLCWPLVAVVALLIKLDSPGPVFFSHDRIGRRGRPFRLYKFRTMTVDTGAYEVSPLNQNDPRITRVGRFLRKTSLDELPQVANVVKGEMSFVGPRPEMPFIVAEYDERHRERLTVLPGITGLWQLSADRERPIHENMDYDLYYINNLSFFLDVTILINTIFFALRGV